MNHILDYETLKGCIRLREEARFETSLTLYNPKTDLVYLLATVDNTGYFRIAATTREIFYTRLYIDQPTQGIAKYRILEQNEKYYKTYVWIKRNCKTMTVEEWYELLQTP